MPRPRLLSHQGWGFPFREKPRFFHVIIGAGVSILSYYLLSLSFRPFLTDAIAQLLSFGQIAVEKPQGFEPPSLILRLMNGSDLSLTFTWQRSGLFSIIVFGLLFVFLAFPLEGPLWLKIAWLKLGSVIGLVWSFIRLSTTALLAYHFGIGAYALAEFLLSPVVDFLWVIPVWSLGLSAVVSAKRKNASSKRGEL